MQYSKQVRHLTPDCVLQCGRNIPIDQISFIVLERNLATSQSQEDSFVGTTGGLHPTSSAVDKAGSLAPPVVPRMI